MDRRTTRSIVGGLVLLVLGVLALFGQFVPNNLSELFATILILGLGVVFIAAGIVTRESGWFVPGGILSGVGMGLAAITGPWQNRLPGDEGGWFLILFSLGWFLIPVLTAIFTDETRWWAFIPGAILGIIGLGVLQVGIFKNFENWGSYIGPAILIVLGLALLFRVRRPRHVDEDEPIEKHA